MYAYVCMCADDVSTCGFPARTVTNVTQNGQLSGTTDGLTGNAFECATGSGGWCFGSSAPEAVYRLSAASADRSVTVVMQPAVFDASLYAWEVETSDGCTKVRQVATHDRYYNGVAEQISFTANAGKVYLVSHQSRQAAVVSEVHGALVQPLSMGANRTKLCMNCSGH